MVEQILIRKIILVFKTNLDESQEILVRGALSTFKDIINIDFDFEDCDNIMRDESKNNILKQVVKLMTEKGFYCMELI